MGFLLFGVFLEREGKGERERERNIDMREKNIDRLPLTYTLTRDRIHISGMCPDWESNSQTFGLWDSAPTS